MKDQTAVHWTMATRQMSGLLLVALTAVMNRYVEAESVVR